MSHATRMPTLKDNANGVGFGDLVRSPFLTKGMERVLKLMRDNDDELVREGIACWVGGSRTNGATVNRLLVLVLVKTINVPMSYECYEITEDGLGVLDDPAYIPRIARPNTELTDPKDSV